MHTNAKWRAHIAQPSRRLIFIGVFMLAFVVTYSMLYAVGLTPELMVSPSASRTDTLSLGQPQYTPDSVAGSDGEGISGSASPQRVVIDAIDVDTTIVNPQSRDIAVLDEALRRGVVHYPGSGNLEDRSNLFLFGHSSYLPSVQNEAYRAFNNLGKLSEGNVIRVRSDRFEYRYVVASVRLVDANTALVELSDRQKKLTLSTCNSFGEPTERFVVEADFLGQYPLVQEDVDFL